MRSTGWTHCWPSIGNWSKGGLGAPPYRYPVQWKTDAQGSDAFVGGCDGDDPPRRCSCPGPAGAAGSQVVAGATGPAGAQVPRSHRSRRCRECPRFGSRTFRRRPPSRPRRPSFPRARARCRRWQRRWRQRHRRRRRQQHSRGRRRVGRGGLRWWRQLLELRGRRHDVAAPRASCAAAAARRARLAPRRSGGRPSGGCGVRSPGSADASTSWHVTRRASSGCAPASAQARRGRAAASPGSWTSASNGFGSSSAAGSARRARSRAAAVAAPPAAGRSRSRAVRAGRTRAGPAGVRRARGERRSRAGVRPGGVGNPEGGENDSGGILDESSALAPPDLGTGGGRGESATGTSLWVAASLMLLAALAGFATPSLRDRLREDPRRRAGRP